MLVWITFKEKVKCLSYPMLLFFVKNLKRHLCLDVKIVQWRYFGEQIRPYCALIEPWLTSDPCSPFLLSIQYMGQVWELNFN